jgi:putative tryptophan/tyrosine transport system substrate-binding protein
MSADLFFQVQREQVVGLAARHSLPVMYEWSEFVRAGGLISYSSFRMDAFVQSGVYVGRILNGATPADLNGYDQSWRCRPARTRRPPHR